MISLDMTTNQKQRLLGGMAIVNKRDGGTATVVGVALSVPSVAHPGPWGKIIVTVRRDDPAEAAKRGGDQTGDLSWFKSEWKVL